MIRFRTLERRLLVVVLVALAPIVVLSCANLLRSARNQRGELERAMVETMRAMAAAVDTELSRLISVLQVLAANGSLDRGDLKEFYDEAVRVKEGDASWANIELVSVAGKQLANVLGPPDAPLPTKSPGPATFLPVLRERRPSIGPLVLSDPLLGTPTFAVVVPAVRGNELRYVLAGVVRPETMRAVIEKQKVPSDGIVSIFDARGNHVARSRADEQWLGKPGSETLRAMMARGTEGSGPSVTLDGQRIYAAFSRSPATGWSVAVGVPREAIDGPVVRSYATLGAGLALSLALGLLAAFVAARSVSRPIEALRGAAQAVGRGERPPAPRTALPEVREVADALAAAHIERETLLEAERRVRAEVEQQTAAMIRLHEISTRFMHEGDLVSLLQSVLDAVIGATQADFGNIQLLDARTDALEIAVHRGFGSEFLEFFRGVHPGQAACGTAKASGRRIVVEDVLTDPIFADPVMQGVMTRAEVRAVQSTPLVGRFGDFVGMISTHFRQPRRPSDAELRIVDLFARQAADLIEHHRALAGREESYVSARRLAAIVESSDDAIIGKTLEGIITSWNPAAAEMFGFSEAEAVGQPITLIVPPERLDEEAEVLRRLRSGETIDHFETVRIRKAGPRIDVSLTVSPIRDGTGRIVGVSTIARDVSERKRAETERTALLVRERTARAEAEAANRAKDEFLAIVSHELRTPLNAVYGWARILLAGQIRDGEATRALEAIVRNANAQVQLIDDLLDVSRVITGKMRLDVRSVDLRAVIEAGLDAVRPAAAAKEIRLQSVLDPRAGPITGDPTRLQQVVWNLLMNAVKFTPKGGRVQAHLQRINSHVEIVVSDTGQGIAPDVLPFVFDRFRQADSSSTRAHGGLGLGLALVKHLIELHGGSVTAQSPGEGQGATFIVKVPLTIAEIPAGRASRLHPTASAMEALPQGARLDGLRVLVVDDDPDALDLASEILTRAGAVVRTALSTPDALDVFQQWRPDVLVSDIEMPGEDGYSLIRKVRARGGEQGGKTPAVALTAYGRTQDRMLSLIAGYNMHVPKPVDPGEFTTIIASVAGWPQA